MATSKSTIKRGYDLKLLINGYIREKEKEYKLYMYIPSEIAQIMQDLYPVLIFKFGDFNKDHFVVNDDRTILKGDCLNCNGYLVYADLGHYNDIGFNKGVYFWSIENLADGATCMLSIGVTTEKSDKLVNEWKHNATALLIWLDEKACAQQWIKNGFGSFFKGNLNWRKNKVITVKLDCDNWIVTYYRDGKKFKRDDIEPNKSYYFALLCCDQGAYTHLKVVESLNL